MKDVVVIGVAGGTGSGKSTLVKRLQEAFKNDDGSWDVIGVWGPEQIDETGGEWGMLLWSEEKGFSF